MSAIHLDARMSAAERHKRSYGGEVALAALEFVRERLWAALAPCEHAQF